jgi:hypothetical protein
MNDIDLFMPAGRDGCIDRIGPSLPETAIKKLDGVSLAFREQDLQPVVGRVETFTEHI